MDQNRIIVNQSLYRKINGLGYILGTGIYSWLGSATEPPRSAAQTYEEQIDICCRDALGNFLMIWPPRKDTEAMHWWLEGGVVALARRCAERKLYFAFLYLTRHSANPGLIAQIRAAGGDYFLGLCFGELLHYYYMTPGWNKPSEALPCAYGHAETMEGAVEELRREVGKHVAASEALFGGDIPFFTVSAQCLNHVELQTGMAFPFPECFPLDLGIAMAESRGSARAFKIPFFGAYLAHEWYTAHGPDSLPFDHPAKALSLRIGFQYAFLAGARIIQTESGTLTTQTNITYKWGTTELGADSDACRMYRKVQKEFGNYLQDKTPSRDGPEARIGIVHGQTDGWGGHFFNTPWAQWGQWDQAQKIMGRQNGLGWYHRAPEWGWKRMRDVFLPQVTPWFSGTPHGQVDVVPGDAEAEQLERYHTLILLGWNLMDGRQYAALKRYVEQGGTLFLGLAHFNTNGSRIVDWVSHELSLWRDGDFRDLLGYRVALKNIRHRPYFLKQGFDLDGTTRAPEQVREYAIPFGCLLGGPFLDCGHPDDMDSNRVKVIMDGELSNGERVPFLTRTKLGKGQVYCLTTRTWPGDEHLNGAIDDLLDQLAVSARGDVYITDVDKATVTGDARWIDWAVYRDRGLVYLLNVDIMRTRHLALHIGGALRKVSLQPGEFVETGLNPSGK